MQLYSTPISPYSARCRIQIAHKQLPVEIVAPPGGMRSEAVLAVNPTGRIPVLVTDQACLAESWAIMEFLESTFPSPAMRPDDAFASARQTEIVRFADQYLAPAMFPLFKALRGAGSDEEIKAAADGLQAQMSLIEKMLPAVQDSVAGLSLADAALVPIIWYGMILGRHFGGAADLSGWPSIHSWWQQLQQNPAVATVVTEMETALKAAIPPIFADAYS